MADKTKLENFVGELTQGETADLATIALAHLPDELAVTTVTEWAASAGVVTELLDALENTTESDDEDENEYQDEDDEEEPA